MMFGGTGQTLSACAHLEENNFLKSTPKYKKEFLECSTLKASARIEQGAIRGRITKNKKYNPRKNESNPIRKWQKSPVKAQCVLLSM